MQAFVGSAAPEHLSETAKAHQRADLLALASSMSNASSPQAPNASTPNPKPASRSRRILWLASALAVAVLALNLVLSVLPGRRDQDPQALATRLLVPAAQSAQAFALEPAQSTSAGMDRARGWVLRTAVPVSQQAIERAVRIDPPVDVRVERVDDASWSLTPTQPLTGNAVYRVSLAAALQADNQETPYEYTWVTQTVGAFALEAVTPGPGTAAVPADTAFEWTFSRSGFMSASSSVQILPAVAGHFETRDRTLIFLPDRPLTRGQVYRVTLKRGFGIADVPSMQLTEDISYAFQVASDDQVEPEYSLRLALPTQVQVASTKPIRFAVNAEAVKNGEGGQMRPLTVEGYALTPDEAERYLATRSQRFGWFEWTRPERQSIGQIVTGKQSAFRHTNVVAVSDEGGWQSIAEIPSAPAGAYLVRVSASGLEEDYTLVQVSDLAVHVMADQDKALFWVMQARTRQPVVGAQVVLGGQNVQTDADGLATVALPLGLTSDQPLARTWEGARVTQGDQRTILEIAPPASPFDFYRDIDPQEGLRRTWAYLYQDRAVQRQDDTISIFGLALDRTTKQVPSGLKLRLTQANYAYDIRRPLTTPTLAEQDLSPDASGRFQASFTWKNRPSGSYTIQLLRDGKAVTSIGFNVRPDAKPRMAIGLELDQKATYMGDVVTGMVKAIFVDGTPFPNADIRVQAAQYGGNVFDQILRTNDQGVAAFRIPTNRAIPCIPTNPQATDAFSGDCYGRDQLTVTASAQTGEEGDSSVLSVVPLYPGQRVFRGREGVDQYSQYAPNTSITAPGRLSVFGTVKDVVTPDASVEDLRAAPGAAAMVALYRADRAERQTGTRYDAELRRTVPIMQGYVTLSLESRHPVTTDAQGAFALDLPLQSTTSHYQVLLTATDGRGRTTSLLQYAFPPNPTFEGAVSGRGGSTEPLFMLSRTDDPERLDESAYSDADLNRRVSYRLKDDTGRPLDVIAYSRPLYVIASRGLKKTVVSTDANFAFTFDESLYPNLGIFGIVFTEHGFKVASGNLSVRRTPFMLEVEATTDKEAYTPSSTAQVRLKVKGQQGEGVSGVKVAVSVADQALSSLYAFTDLNPLEWLYGYTDDGVRQVATTHQDAKAMNGGAEGGGGGGGDALLSPRKNFKDQADFVVVETDANGEAVAAINLPDNITTWRLQAIALSRDLRAGHVIIQRPATKSLAVDAVVPRQVYVGDQIQLKLRPIAVELAADAAVEYVVNAPTLGINRQSVRATGRANAYVPITITPAMLGTHTVQVGIIATGRQDAMEFPIRVVEKQYTKTIWEQAEAVSGFRLPETLAGESTLLVTSPERAALLPEVQRRAEEASSSRLETRLAGRLAQALRRTLDPQASNEPTTLDWTLYQDAAGSLKPLPQSSGDVDASFKAVLSGERGFDETALIRFLDATLQSKEATREIRIKAAGALAFLGRPTLKALQEAAAQPNLTWQERAALLRTYVALGDRVAVQALYDSWMEKMVAQDGARFVDIEASDRSRFEATRVAAYAALFLRDGRAAELQSYLTRVGLDQPAFDPLLDTQTLKFRLEQAPNTETKVVYRLGNDTHEINLKDGPVTVSLVGEGQQLFSIDRVEGGKAFIQWSRRVPGVPAQNERLSIQRTYRSLSGTGPIKEGDSVQVTLRPTFGSRDTFACYEIRDALPANVRPIIDWTFSGPAWTPVRQDDGGLTFTACNSYQTDITYTVQVIAPGTYYAPAPVMQHLELPSLAAVGREDSLTAVPR